MSRLGVARARDAVPARVPGISGLLFAVTSGAAFAMQGLFAKLAYEANATTTTVGLGRFGLTAAVLWAYAVWRNRTGAFALRLPRRTVVALLLLGGLGYAFSSLAYLGAVTTISVSLAGLLLYTYPAIATTLAVWMGRERSTPRLIVGIGTALLGVGVTLGVPAISAVRGTDPRGILLVLLAATLYGAYIVGSARTLEGVHAVLAMAYIATGATVSYALLTAVTRTFTSGIGPSGWASIAAMGVVSTVVAAGAFLAAIRRLGPARAATASTVEPLCTIVFAAIVLGERLSFYQAAGGLLILMGVIIVMREREAATAPEL